MSRSGALQVGDRVLSINGTVTDRLTHSEVAALLDNSGNIVNLEIAFEASGMWESGGGKRGRGREREGERERGREIGKG